MLHFVQHDQTDRVIPSASEESKVWMLHFVQHDKHCHSERQRGIQSMDASLRSA